MGCFAIYKIFFEESRDDLPKHLDEKKRSRDPAAPPANKHVDNKKRSQDAITIEEINGCARLRRIVGRFIMGFVFGAVVAVILWCLQRASPAASELSALHCTIVNKLISTFGTKGCTTNTTIMACEGRSNIYQYDDCVARIHYEWTWESEEEDGPTKHPSSFEWINLPPKVLLLYGPKGSGWFNKYEEFDLPDGNFSMNDCCKMSDCGKIDCFEQSLDEIFMWLDAFDIIENNSC